LGKHYAPYADATKVNGVDGFMLATLSCSEIPETLDDLQIQNRLHRRVIERKLSVLSLVSTDGDSSQSDCDDCCRDDGTAKTENESEEFEILTSSPDDSDEKDRILECMAATMEAHWHEREELVSRLQTLESEEYDIPTSSPDDSDEKDRILECMAATMEANCREREELVSHLQTLEV
jgi:hypothetical protein